eukprot:Opistho-2@18916
MGNLFSGCTKGADADVVPEKDIALGAPRISVANAVDKEEDERVQHISDREGGGGQQDTLFTSVMPDNNRVASMRRFSSERKPSRRESVRSMHSGADGMVTKSNSCSTLFVDSTVSQPDMDETLRCVASAIYFFVRAGHKETDPLLDPIFDEKTHPLSKSISAEEYGRMLANEEPIYNFVKLVFTSAALTGECAIISLVYIERLIASTGMTIHSTNWKRIMLGSILLASKVWDDQAVWNVDFVSILPDVQVADLNQLEKSFLEKIYFNVSVPASVYTKYYLDLRGLAEDSKRNFTMKPLDTSKAQKLEAMTLATEQSMRQGEPIKRSRSMDLYEPKPPAAILS